MASTLLIVESPNDKAFMELLLAQPQAAEISTIQPTEIEHLHNFLGTDGKEKRGKTALSQKLQVTRSELSKTKAHIQHVAVIVDADSPPHGGQAQSLALINRAFEEAFGVDPRFSAPGEVITPTVDLLGEKISLSLSCFLMQDATGEGNLDTVLKAIASRSCVESDCLEEMNRCVEAQTGQPMRDFTKQWVNYYLRSFAHKKQLNNAEARLHEVISAHGRDMFDLDAPLVAGLKAYLRRIASG